MVQKPPVIFLVYANDKAEQGVYLRNLSKEMHGIRSALTDAAKLGLCEIVERPSATIADIVDVFQDPEYNSRIAIFHYAGHANGDALLLETIDEGHSMAHKGGLVDILSRQEYLKLVFFNGCSSHEHTDALLAKGVPAAIGTATAINDDIATQLSIRFYKGLSMGSGIEKSWNDSVDEAKIGGGLSEENTRGLSWAGKGSDVQNEFPWTLKFNENATQLRNWNLPETIGDALFGLPGLPVQRLPESPFPDLNPYDRTYAELFFGRSRYIRNLYLLVTDKQAPSIILLYGQSGVGKTSLIEAGVVPRLEKAFEVISIQRNESLGLYSTLYRVLLQKCGFSTAIKADEQMLQVTENTLVTSLEQIANSMDEEMQPEFAKLITRVKAKYSPLSLEGGSASAPANLGDAWRMAEEVVKKPILIVLDQVDEAFTNPNSSISGEVNELLWNLKKVFENPELMPAGKIILCYRQEYQPDIEEYCTNNEVARSRLLLDSLTKGDILTILGALRDNTRLQTAYNLTIENSLDELIAVDYSRGINESPISPFLQMTLYKMWLTTTERNPGKPLFSVALYNEIEDESLVIQQFLQRQLEAINKKMPDSDVYSSGLVLDILFQHCTKNNTAGACTEKEIEARYPFAQEIALKTLAHCKELLLLIVSSENNKTTILSHDTLAMEVSKAYSNSTKPLQQAYRLLNASSIATDSAKQKYLLDNYEITTIESAMPYLRRLTDKENKLITESKKDQRERARNKKNLGYAKTLLIIFSITGALVIGYLLKISRIHEKQSYMSREASESKALLNTDNTLSLLTAAEGFEAGGLDHAIPLIKEAITTSFYTAIDSNRPFYKNVVVSPYAFLNVVYNTQKELFVPFPQDSAATMYDFNGKKTATLSARRKRSGQNFSLLQNAQLTSDQIHILGLGSDSVLRMWDMTGANIYESDTGKPISIFVAAHVKNMFITLSGNTVELHYNLSKTAFKHFVLPQRCNNLVCSPDGNQLIVSYPNGETEMIGLGNVNEIKSKPMIYTGGRILSALYSHQGQFILTSYSDSVLILWDSSGKKLNQFAKLPTEIKGVAFHPSDSIFLVYSGHDGYIFSAWDYKQKHDPVHHKDLVTFVRFSPDGSKLITGSSDRCGVIWSLKGAPNLSLMGHVNDITCGFFSADEKTVFTTSLDGTVKAWNLDIYHGPLFKASHVSDIEIQPNGKHLCSVGKDSTLSVWGLSDQGGELIASKKFFSQLSKPAFSRNSTKILCVTSRNTTITWDWQAQNMPVIMNGHTDTITAAGFIGVDSAVSISCDQTIRFWDNSGTCFKMIRDITDKFCTLNISANGNRIVAGMGSGAIYIFDRAANIRDTLRGHKLNAAILCADISADGKRLVTASDDNTVIIWDLEKRTHVVLDKPTEAPYYKLKINSAKFSPNNLFVVTASSDRAARVWGMNGHLTTTLYGHTGNVTDAMFTPHNNIVTASDDGTIRYWLMNGDEISRLCCQKAGGARLAVDSSGEKIFSVSDAGTIRTWLTPRGVFRWVEDQQFYKYFKEFGDKYK